MSTSTPGGVSLGTCSRMSETYEVNLYSVTVISDRITTGNVYIIVGQGVTLKSVVKILFCLSLWASSRSFLSILNITSLEFESTSPTECAL